MEITYLKTTGLANKINTAIKITPKGVLYVTSIEISIDELTDSMESEVVWYKKEFNTEHCTKEEFDNFYIDTVKNINELSKL